jgi:tRNA A37 threonylcarbamoyltransferase TsaD
MATEHDAKFSVPGKYCGDNGVMIAMLGKKMFDAGLRTTFEDSIVLPNQRTDDVDVIW